MIIDCHYHLEQRLLPHYLTCNIGEEDGELWDENGKLLAISRQIDQFRK